jgi:hypothetical protein
MCLFLGTSREISRSENKAVFDIDDAGIFFTRSSSHCVVCIRCLVATIGNRKFFLWDSQCIGCVRDQVLEKIRRGAIFPSVMTSPIAINWPSAQPHNPPPLSLRHWAAPDSDLRYQNL